ncbi:MAG: class I SAM-dependent RNA methyltransferase, partial [Deltaproteobacteria bacterium]
MRLRSQAASKARRPGDPLSNHEVRFRLPRSPSTQGPEYARPGRGGRKRRRSGPCAFHRRNWDSLWHFQPHTRSWRQGRRRKRPCRRTGQMEQEAVCKHRFRQPARLATQRRHGKLRHGRCIRVPQRPGTLPPAEKKVRKVRHSATAPRRGDMIELQTTGIATDGKAVGRLGALVVFVSGALPGERVAASVEKVTPRYVVARVSEILDANPGRTQPACSAFGDCGGCQMMHAGPELQLELRKNLVLDALATVAGVSDAPEPVLWPAQRHLGYRNRGQYPAARQVGKTVCGFYASGSHRVVPVDRCPLHMEQVNTAVTCVRSWANAKGISAYDEVRHAGALRHVAVR